MSDTCIFCRIVAGAIPANIAYQDELITAFHDIDPKAPTHVLVIPNRHLESLAETGPQDAALLGHLFSRVPAIAAALGLAPAGYRVVVNVGRDAGMAVYHLHVHILGGRRLAWPPG